MGKFSNIGKVSVSKSGQYFTAGNYQVRIKAVKIVPSQAGGNKEYFVIETEVLDSDNPQIKPGSERSHVIDMTNVMSMPNIKAFVAAVSGVDPSSGAINEEVEEYWQKWGLEQGIVEEGEEVTFERVCDLIVDSVNILEGTVMDLECTDVITKKEREAAKAAGRDPKADFTKHNWIPRDL